MLGLALMVGTAAAEPNAATGGGTADGAVSVLPDVEKDQTMAPAAAASPFVTKPIVTKPIVAKPLTPADLPPPSVFAPRHPTYLAVAVDRKGRDDSSPYRAILDREAVAAGVPPELADAVMAVESSYNPATVGADGEIGLMQLMPATASMLGFTGTLAELADPEINIHYGVMYLAAAWRLAGQDICTATMKYRAGHGEMRFSFRSVDYCIRVRAHLAAHGYPVTGVVPSPTFGQPFGATSPGRLRFARAGTVDLQVLNARLREMTDSIAVRVPR